MASLWPLLTYLLVLVLLLLKGNTSFFSVAVCGLMTATTWLLFLILGGSSGDCEDVWLLCSDVSDSALTLDFSSSVFRDRGVALALLPVLGGKLVTLLRSEGRIALPLDACWCFLNF